MKKIINTLLVLAVVLVQLIPSSLVNAATISGKGGTNGTITIDNAIEGKTYTIYRIFDLESYSYDKDDQGNITNPAFVYKVSANWTNFINQNTIKGVYVNVDNDGVVTWVNGADVSAFAKLAISYAKTNNITYDGQQKAETTPLVFSDLTLGYYLVDSTVGTLCGLNTTKPNVTISEKNDVPTIDKKVKDVNTWEDENNAQIGDKVEYKTTITVKSGAENYVLKDTMTEGLTPNNDVEVFIGSNKVSSDNYTITYENNGFTLSFKNEYISTLEADTVITVTYSATLNEKALICKPNACGHNDNKTYLEYGDNNKTNEDETRTYTYEFKLVKTKKDGTELTGAEFKLYDALTGGNEIKVFEVSTGVYRVAKTAEELEKAEKTTIKAGTAIIEGLDSDKTYYLEEVVQPAGYNKLTSRVEVKLNEKTGLGETTNVIEVVKTVINYTGTELPSTGGIGTTLFITIGSILVLAIGTILVTKLRVSKMEI